jgi:hypothetical protein
MNPETVFRKKQKESRKKCEFAVLWKSSRLDGSEDRAYKSGESQRARARLFVMNIRKLLAVAISCVLLLVALIEAELDDWSGASCYWAFELAYVLIGVIFGAFAYTEGKHRAFLVVPSIYLLFVIALPFLDLSPVKPAVRSVREIEPGMSEAQVRAILDRHFPEHGHFKRPEIGAVTNDAIGFVLDRNDGRYDAAVVAIKFSGGKCVSAEFSAD